MSFRERCLEQLTPGRALMAAVILIGLGVGIYFGPELRTTISRAAHSETFALEHMAVRGLARVSTEAVSEVVQLPAGIALVDVDTTEIETRLRQHPWVRRADVMRLPPSTLLLDIRERIPLAICELATGPHLLDVSGNPFAPAEASDLERLPYLEVEAVLPPGEPNSRAARGIQLLDAAASSGLPPVRHLALGQELAWLRLKGIEARILFEPDAWLTQFGTLRRLLTANLAETQKAREIDLRFADRAILRDQAAPDGARTKTSRRTAAASWQGPAG